MYTAERWLVSSRVLELIIFIKQTDFQIEMRKYSLCYWLQCTTSGSN